MKKILILFLILHSAISINTTAQTEVRAFQPGANVDGVSYYLPRTAVRVVLTAEKTTVTPGELARYAYRYMHIQDVPTQKSTTWKIKKVELQPYGVPDADKAYSIRLKGRTLAPLVSLTRDGLILGINTEVTEQQLPALPEVEEPAAKPNPQKYLSQDMLSAGSAAKLAELVAEEIYDIRDSRGSLLRGEADNTPKDGAQLQLMLDGIDQEDAALTGMFQGTTETRTEIYTLDVTPAEATDKLLLCRFSQKLGILDTDDMAGSPLYIRISPQNAAATDTANIQRDNARKEKTAQGVRYNIPVMTSLEVYDAHDSYAALDTPMSQFGTTEILSNTLFDKRTTTKVTFYQSTGGIKKIEE